MWKWPHVSCMLYEGLLQYRVGWYRSPDILEVSSCPSLKALMDLLPALWWTKQMEIGISTGNPGVFKGYPHPYPSKPVPAPRVRVIRMWGYGLSGVATRALPQHGFGYKIVY